MVHVCGFLVDTELLLTKNIHVYFFSLFIHRCFRRAWLTS